MKIRKIEYDLRSLRQDVMDGIDWKAVAKADKIQAIQLARIQGDLNLKEAKKKVEDFLEESE